MAHNQLADANSSEMLYKPDETDAVVQATTRMGDYTNSNPYRFIKFREQSFKQLFTSAGEAKPEHGMGELECFPSEIMIQIILGLDLKACLAVRQTNRAARKLVTGLSEYRIVVTDAFLIFDAVFMAGMAGRVTLQNLYRLLCEHECMICNSKDSSDSLRFFDSRAPKSKPKIAKGVNAVDVYRVSLNKVLDGLDSNSKAKKRDAAGSVKQPQHTTVDPLLAGLAAKGSRGTASAMHKSQSESSAGMYLFLPTMTRCCRPCLDESPRLIVPDVHRLCMAASLPLKHFESALCMPMPIWAHGVHINNAASGTVPQDAATRLLLDAGYTPRTAKDVLLGSGYLCEFGWVDDLERRYQFAVPMPFLSPKGREVTSGLTCAGCITAMERVYKRLKVTLVYTTPMYGTRKAYLDHFEHCPEAIKMWKDHQAKARKRKHK